ncbi:MAG: glucosyltransferase domain-containing protein [Lachnospiraceae bacterium]|nr:glucosyltransferase domain-containing protein [Lachnospiraceae bacterium]
MTVNDALEKINKRITKEDRTAFVSAFLGGLLIHMPVMLKDVPNHDGLASMYFSQNMITSGRWFLSAVCAASSFYTVPWVIGLIGILELALTAVLLVRIFEIWDRISIYIISALLVSFPALASTFAYVFTLDGYMAGLFLAVLAVYLVKKDHFLLGGISLAFSLGVYQSYLPFAMLLSIYCVWDVMAKGEKGSVKKCMNYLYMGITGAVLYIVILEILLKIEGKVLDTYQGIDSLENAGLSGRLSALPGMYRDFVSFTFSKGFLTGYVCAAAALVLFACGAVSAIALIVKYGAFKKAWFWWVSLLTAVLVPLSANIVLFITPKVQYHLIMRYQWVLLLIVCVALCDRCVAKEIIGKGRGLLSFAFVISALAVIIAYAVTDNIAYTSLQRKYEKTYAYAVRLLDRIEQTEGYYQGIPIAIMGVIGEDEYPPSEITAPVTGDMIGYDRQYLIYTADNYEAFFKYYLGATLNFISEEEEEKIYYSDEYIEMESFPGETSIKLVDGVIWVKTEDAARE